MNEKVNIYKVNTEITPKQFYTYGFIKNDDGVFTYKRPVYKYNQKTVLWAQINILSDNDTFLRVEIVDSNNDKYPAYYNRTYRNEVVDVIDKNVEIELNNLVKNNIIKKRKNK